MPLTPPLFPLSHGNQVSFIPPPPPPLPSAPVCINPPFYSYPDQLPPPPPNQVTSRACTTFNGLLCGSYPMAPVPHLRYGNPYHRDVPRTVRYPPQYTVLTIPDSPTPPTEAEDENNNRSSGFYGNTTLGCAGNVSSTSESSPQVVDTQDGASAASAAVSDISDFDLHDGLEVLVAGPAELPAPMQPEVLPTAKMAAIKHANQGQSCPNYV